MQMEEAFLKRLTDGDVTDDVAWGELPQDASKPSIRLFKAFADREQHMTGNQALQRALIQVDCFGPTYASANALKEAAIACLVPIHIGDGWRFDRSFVERERDSTDDQNEETVFQASFDLNTHFAPHP